MGQPAQADLQPFVRFNVWTGLRLEEMLELHWPDVDLARKQRLGRPRPRRTHRERPQDCRQRALRFAATESIHVLEVARGISCVTCGAARKESLASVVHCQDRYANSRAEASRQHTASTGTEDAHSYRAKLKQNRGSFSGNSRQLEVRGARTEARLARTTCCHFALEPNEFLRPATHVQLLAGDNDWTYLIRVGDIGRPEKGGKLPKASCLACKKETLRAIR